MSIVKSRFPAIDAHTHIEVDGIPAAIEMMDAAGIDAMVNLTGLHANAPLEFAARLRQFPEKVARRFAFYVMMNYEGIEDSGWGRREADRIEETVKAGASGLKELKRLGLNVRDNSGKLIAVDDPRLDPVWDRCGSLGIPVSIHTSDPLAFHQPLTLDNERFVELQVHPDWYFMRPGLPAKIELLEARNRVIARHPATNFVCVHVANFPEDLVTVALWLERHPNMYIDTSARFVELGRHHPEMVRNFFVRYQDRILFGTDTGISAAGQMLGVAMPADGEFFKRDDYRDAILLRYFGSMYRYLESADYYIPSPTPVQGSWPLHGIALPDGVLRKVYRENALRLIPGLKIDMPTVAVGAN